MIAYYKPKFKQPDIIACQWTENVREMHDFLGGDPNEHLTSHNENFYIDHHKNESGLIIKTNIGDIPVKIGDYVIKHPFYYHVVSKNDFESYYELSEISIIPNTLPIVTHPLSSTPEPFFKNINI